VARVHRKDGHLVAPRYPQDRQGQGGGRSDRAARRGRWYERDDDGSTCDWGRVLAWEPPSRLVLSWEISADFQYDPNLKTEVEVRFITEGKDGTRVELEHRYLDRYGARRDQVRRIFDSDAGWKGLLEAFAARASEGEDR
jgi:uncharacterized protein YndB with AHSA1/START domain